MNHWVPDGIGPDALILIVRGPVPFMVAVSGPQKEAVVEAYRRAGIPIEVVEERRAAS